MKALGSAQRNNDQTKTLTYPIRCHVSSDGLFTKSVFFKAADVVVHRMSFSVWLLLEEEKQHNVKKKRERLYSWHKPKEDKNPWNSQKFMMQVARPLLPPGRPKRGRSSAGPESGFLWFLWPPPHLAASGLLWQAHVCPPGCQLLGEHTCWLDIVLLCMKTAKAAVIYSNNHNHKYTRWILPETRKRSL